MVKRTTVENWGFSCLGMEIDDSDEVIKIFCKTCREFFSKEKETNAMLLQCFKGITEIYRSIKCLY